MRRFVGGVRDNGLRFRESCCYTVIDFIKSHAVMDISGGNHGFQHKSMLIAGRVGLIGKLPLVVSLHKQAAVRVGHALCHRAFLLFFPPGQFLLGGVVPALLGWRRRLVIIVKGLLSVGLPVCVYLFHQFFGIMLGRRRNLRLHLLFRVGVGFDVRAVYEYRLG